jgi:hypothetical protein
VDNGGGFVPAMTWFRESADESTLPRGSADNSEDSVSDTA